MMRIDEQHPAPLSGLLRPGLHMKEASIWTGQGYRSVIVPDWWNPQLAFEVTMPTIDYNEHRFQLPTDETWDDGRSLLAEVLGALEKKWETKGVRGDYILLFGLDWDRFLDNDYLEYAENPKTIAEMTVRQRLERIAGIRAVRTVARRLIEGVNWHYEDVVPHDYSAILPKELADQVQPPFMSQRR